MKLPFNAFDLPEPPPVPTFTNPGRELTGWEEFDQWARLNDHVWAEARRASDIHFVPELDTLRYLAAAMLSQSCHYRKLALDAALMVPPRILVVDPNANP